MFEGACELLESSTANVTDPFLELAHQLRFKAYKANWSSNSTSSKKDDVFESLRFLAHTFFIMKNRVIVFPTDLVCPVIWHILLVDERKHFYTPEVVEWAVQRHRHEIWIIPCIGKLHGTSRIYTEYTPYIDCI